MTDKQLAVLLRSFITRLERAIAEAEAGLPDDVERHTMRKYVGTGYPIFPGLDRNPDHWETVIPAGASSVALDPLREFVDDVVSYVVTLEER
jgi:hypothetical protein